MAGGMTWPMRSCAALPCLVIAALGLTVAPGLSGFASHGSPYSQVALAAVEERSEKPPAVYSIEETIEGGERTWRIKGACEETPATSSGPTEGGYVWRIGPAPSVEAAPYGDCSRLGTADPYQNYPYYHPFVDIVIKPGDRPKSSR